jgi:hypothetical protein
MFAAKRQGLLGATPGKAGGFRNICTCNLSGDRNIPDQGALPCDE